jgi:hypothetical protein
VALEALPVRLRLHLHRGAGWRFWNWIDTLALWGQHLSAQRVCAPRKFMSNSFETWREAAEPPFVRVSEWKQRYSHTTQFIFTWCVHMDVHSWLWSRCLLGHIGTLKAVIYPMQLQWPRHHLSHVVVGMPAASIVNENANPMAATPKANAGWGWNPTPAFHPVDTRWALQK